MGPLGRDRRVRRTVESHKPARSQRTSRQPGARAESSEAEESEEVLFGAGEPGEPGAVVEVRIRKVKRSKWQLHLQAAVFPTPIQLKKILAAKEADGSF